MIFKVFFNQILPFKKIQIISNFLTLKKFYFYIGVAPLDQKRSHLYLHHLLLGIPLWYEMMNP